MIRFIPLFIFGIFASLTASAADTAQKLLADAASKIETAPSVNANFTLSSNGHTDNGSIVMAGHKFVVETSRMSVWFDGSTQWTWSADTREVTVTTPTPQELAQINPLSILSSLRNDYIATLLPSGQSVKKLRLTAKKPDAEIRQAEVTLNATTLAPAKFVVSYSGGTVVTVDITDYAIRQKKPLTVFRYDPKSHPDAEIIDLR